MAYAHRLIFWGLWLGDNQAWYVVPDADGSDDARLVLCAGICAPVTLSKSPVMCVLGGPVP